MKTIVLFTNSYPYSKYGEYTFIEPELKILSRYFKIILVPLSKETDYPRQLVNYLNNVSVKEVEFSKHKEIFNIFKLDHSLFKELNNINNFYSFKDLVVRYVRMKWIEKFIKDQLESNQWNRDYIYYTYWFDFTTTALINLKEKYNLKVITRAHRYDLYEERRNNYIPFRNRDVKKIDKIITISMNGYNYLRDKYNVRNIIINSYLGIEDFNVENPLNTSEDVIKLVSCSLMTPVKRIDLIMKYLSRFSKENRKKIEWHHIGSGNLEKELKLLATKFEHKIFKIKFVGYLENREIFDYYKNNAFDYFITLSESEGLPVSLMEASSVGLPIIATNVGGIEEIVFEDKNGFLLSSNPSYDEFRKKFSKAWKIKGNKQNYLILRQNARQIYEEIFSARVCFERFAMTLKELEI